MRRSIKDDNYIKNIIFLFVFILKYALSTVTNVWLHITSVKIKIIRISHNSVSYI